MQGNASEQGMHRFASLAMPRKPKVGEVVHFKRTES
jgi:hypothetical protein